MENLSTTFTRLMSEKGMSSAELARQTGVAQPVIYRLMAGTTNNPQILSLIPIVNFFGISIEQLLGLTSLDNPGPLNDKQLHDINTKLSTLKMISTVLIDLLPELIEGYQKAVAAGLTKEVVSADILPLLMLNTTTLLKTTNQIQEILKSNIVREN